MELTTILSLIIPLLITMQVQMAFSSEIEDDEEYVLDSPLLNFRSRSRFLGSVIKQGAKCNPIKKNICNGILANKGTSLLFCCKIKCVNVLGDRNHCGQCGRKCKLGELCCHGTCVLYQHFKQCKQLWQVR
ncbi:unnamed protein product [Prunus armeniaca]|uniref:Stigma-specific STIG1-like protein 1 n=1 Tax=Prunus armeniaca TaxID=36596 RepID=A0A6J5X7B9_PRUAR|nr:unnamed protein product [Prunus armeniaca]